MSKVTHEPQAAYRPVNGAAPPAVGAGRRPGAPAPHGDWGGPDAGGPARWPRRTWLGAVFTAPAAGALLLAVPGATPAAAQAPAPLTVPVTLSGTFANPPGGPGTFAGNFTLQRFTTSNGALAAVGTLAGTVTTGLGQTVGTVSQQIALPAQATGSCTILHLELGPLDLNLLGLVVHLDRVVLDITAQQAPGNLLGNLLCAIANLLDSNAAATALAAVLNRLLRVLG